MNQAFAVILADSTSHALRIEKLIKQQGLACKLIPVPRHLSSDCGVCVRIQKQDADVIRMLLQEGQIHFLTIEDL